jgi:hypothetical protein
VKTRGWASGGAAALVAALAAFGACGEADDGAPPACDRCWCEPPKDAPAAEVTLGTFDGTAFAPLADGDTLDLQAGPQGGHHFLVAVRTRSIDLASARTLLSASQGGADVDALSCPYHILYVTGANGWATLPHAVALVVDEGWVASGAAEGVLVTVRAEVQDDRGAYGFDERTVLARLLP